MYYTPHIAPPKTDRRKIVMDAGGSTAFLVAILTYTLDTFIRSTQIVDGLSFSMFGIAAVYDALIFVALAAMIPRILICIGMWLFFAASRNNELSRGRLNFLKAGIIAQFALEFSVGGYMLVYSLTRDNYSFRLPDLLNLEPLIRGSDFLAIWAIITSILTVGMVGVYLFGILKTLGITKRSLEEAGWSGTIPVPLIVINYILAASALIAALPEFGGNIAVASYNVCQAATLVLINMKLHHLRSRI